MKKLVIFSETLFMSLAIFVSSCSNTNKTNSETEQETVAEVDYTALYENALSLSAGEVEKKSEPGPFLFMCYMPLTVQNNTNLTFSPEDYIIEYQYEDEDTVDGDLMTVTFDKTMQGSELNPNSKNEIIIKQPGLTIKNPSVKLTISQEDFEKRYKEVQNK